ncbi:MAG TPA: RagB/SusD family nutrient uptake outer membrane protein [Cyclobacteriaceae bacterium]|nr:RagB/SusD family nutrient uptake outer membrane protein [Cyclobacteriaceae bacterium]
MKNLKKIVSAVLMAVPLVIITSCDDKFLKEDARTQITDNYLSTPVGFNDAVNGVYSYLRIFIENESVPHMTTMGTDLWSNGFDGGYKAFNYYDANLNSRTSVFDGVWNRLYAGINSANAVITRAPDIAGLDEAVKNQRVAETKFMRALFYHFLVQAWGPVYITTTETTGIITEAPRSPVSEVYDLIVKDLTEAIPLLPGTATGSNYGRVTKPAAEHLLALVYLTRAGGSAAKADDYKNAAALAEGVIKNYNFKLLDDFSAVFALGEAVERHAEVVFAIQNSQSFLTGELGNTLHAYWLAKYDDLPGVTRDLANGRPWARFRPTNFTLTTLFDKAKDARYEKSFKRVFYTNTPGTFTKVQGGTMTLKNGDTALYIVDEQWPADKLAAAKYSVYQLSRQSDRVYPTLTKFLDPTRASVPEMRGTRDFLLFRLAETMLIASEALMMDNRSAEAVVYINQIRRRAAKVGKTPAETAANKLAMEVTPADLNIDFILDERGRELLGEMKRWFDLTRTGKLVERVKKYNPAATGIKQTHTLRPIPQNQIDRSSSPHDQNEGYN